MKEEGYGVRYISPLDENGNEERLSKNGNELCPVFVTSLGMALPKYWEALHASGIRTRTI